VLKAVSVARGPRAMKMGARLVMCGGLVRGAAAAAKVELVVWLMALEAFPEFF
jgi:hypothetical protein